MANKKHKSNNNYKANDGFQSAYSKKTRLFIIVLAGLMVAGILVTMIGYMIWNGIQNSAQPNTQQSEDHSGHDHADHAASSSSTQQSENHDGHNNGTTSSSSATTSSSK